MQTVENVLPPTLTITCEEPEGKIVREVRPMILSREKLLKFWNSSKKFPTLFSQEVRSDFSKFASVFVSETPEGNVKANGLLWEVDDMVGVFYLNEFIYHGPSIVDAQAHYTFFDGRFRGRVELTQKMLAYVFNTFRLRRISTVVPKYARPYADKFAQDLGFKKEGRKRKCVFFNGQWFDATLYGILAEEAIQNGDGN